MKRFVGLVLIGVGTFSFIWGNLPPSEAAKEQLKYEEIKEWLKKQDTKEFDIIFVGKAVACKKGIIVKCNGCPTDIPIITAFDVLRTYKGKARYYEIIARSHPPGKVESQGCFITFQKDKFYLLGARRIDTRNTPNTYWYYLDDINFIQPITLK